MASTVHARRPFYEIDDGDLVMCRSLPLVRSAGAIFYGRESETASEHREVIGSGVGDAFPNSYTAREMYQCGANSGAGNSSHASVNNGLRAHNAVRGN